MAPKRSLQQDALDAERKGKKILIEENGEKNISSSESELEVEEEGLDIWEREARRMFSPKDDHDGWRTWSTQEIAMIEIGVLASTLEVVPDTAPEKLIEDVEDTDSAWIPQDDEQDKDNADTDQAVAADAPEDSDVPKDEPTVADALDTVADLSPIHSDIN